VRPASNRQQTDQCYYLAISSHLELDHITQLPMLVVRFDFDPEEDLAHALDMESVTVPSDVLVDAYFGTPMAENLMPQSTVAQGSVGIKWLIPLAWAPYFMDSKMPYDALKMGRNLLATMIDVNDRTQAAPLFATSCLFLAGDQCCGLPPKPSKSRLRSNDT
jgi:hypothetical protein